MRYLVRIFLCACLFLTSCSEVFEPVSEETKENARGSNGDNVGPEDRSSKNPSQSQPPPFANESSPSAPHDELPSDWSHDGLPVFSESAELENFQDWLDTPTGAKAIEDFAEFDRTRNEMRMKRSAIFSFSSFARDRPLTILTDGHPIYITGHHFENLLIDTSSPQMRSGDAFILASGMSLPTIRSEGRDGKNGADADCSTSEITCVAIDDFISKQKLPVPQIEWEERIFEQNFHFSDSSVKESWRNLVETAIVFPSHETMLTSLCGTSEFARMNFTQKDFDGTLKLKQTINAPVNVVHANEPQILDARIIEGLAGGDGQDAGNVEIYQLSDTDHRSFRTVLGGRGGAGGKNKKIPPTDYSPGLTLESQVLKSELIFDELKGRISASASCISEAGRSPRIMMNDFIGSLKVTGSMLDDEIALYKHTVVIPARSEGRDVSHVTPQLQRFGADGVSGRFVHVRLQNWERWRKRWPTSLPLARASLLQSVIGESSGRFSSELRELRTLPL